MGHESGQPFQKERTDRRLKDNSMPQFPQNLRDNLYFKIPRWHIEDGYWGNLPLASKSIYPAILKHADAQGTCFPSELKISQMAGVTEKTVRVGLKGLDDFPDFNRKPYINRIGHSAYRYKFKVMAEGVESISIKHGFINGGNWSRLTQCAQAIYPVLKCFCRWDYDLYTEYEEIDYENDDDSVSLDPYPLRKYDFIYPDNKNVAQLAGISIRSIPSAYQSLSDNYFMIEDERMIEGWKTWRLFTLPPQTFNQV
jgi:hypothetical protein